MREEPQPIPFTSHLSSVRWAAGLHFSSKMLTPSDLRLIARSFFSGLIDVLSPVRFLIFVMSSKHIRALAAQCFVLNGVIFLGSLLLVENALAPLIHRLLVGESENPHFHSVGHSFSTLFSWLYWVCAFIRLCRVSQGPRVTVLLYLCGRMLVFPVFSPSLVCSARMYAPCPASRFPQLLLIYPVYCISFILNTMWYHDIAEVACKITWGSRKRVGFDYVRWGCILLRICVRHRASRFVHWQKFAYAPRECFPLSVCLSVCACRVFYVLIQFLGCCAFTAGRQQPLPICTVC